MLKKINKSKLFIVTTVFLLLAVVTWLVEIVINPTDLELVLAIAAITFSAMTICLMVCCIAGKICHGISFYRVFAFTDIIMTAIAVGYAVYDIKTSTGWFAGIIGALILMLVVPVLVVLLLGDFVVWFIRRKNNSINPIS